MNISTDNFFHSVTHESRIYCYNRYKRVILNNRVFGSWTVAQGPYKGSQDIFDRSSDLDLLSASNIWYLSETLWYVKFISEVTYSLHSVLYFLSESWALMYSTDNNSMVTHVTVVVFGALIVKVSKLKFHNPPPRFCPLEFRPWHGPQVPASDWREQEGD